MGVLSISWRHIRRSPYQAFAAISIMALTFIVGGLFAFISAGSTRVLDYFEQKPQIIVFFKDTKTDEDIQSLAAKLKSQDKVAAVKFVSKEDALSIYKEQFKNDPLLLEMVSAEILPASIEVSAIKIEYLPELAQTFKNESDVEEIVFQEEVVKRLITWTGTTRKIGLVMVVFLILVSFFTVITVVGMKIALKREEIEILQLVGASTWYIRLPFLFEGAVYGFVGAILGTLLNIGITVYNASFINSFVGFTLLPFPQIFYLVFIIGMALGGVILGLLASSLAVNRYIR